MYKIKHLLKGARHNSILLVTAAVVIILTAAASFIYLFGNNQNISIQTSAESKDLSTSEQASTEPSSVYVDISGCVKKPGVYEVKDNSRIFEVIEKAGGFTKKADTSQINQAETVSDGMKINIPERGESTGSSFTDEGSEASVGSTLININSADEITLQQLPGIGPVTAEKIIRHRNEFGSFSSIEEITQVEGIGEKTLEKIKPLITV